MSLFTRFFRYAQWGGMIAFATQPLVAFAFLGGENLPKNTGLPTGSPIELIGKIINSGLELLGIIALGLILYAGYLWMTAQGEVEKVEKARGILVEATAGLIIIALAYSISFYITEQLGVALGAGVRSTGTR